MTTTTTGNNYERYWQAPFNRPEHYPVEQQPDPALFRPAGDWVVRLVLPHIGERRQVAGVLCEVYHAAGFPQLVGSVVRLRWADMPQLHARFWGVSRAVIFDEEAQRTAAGGAVLGERLNGLIVVNPFESLAGAHPYDDVIVRLDAPVEVDLQPRDGGAPIVFVRDEPLQISGRYYALVQFRGPHDGDMYEVQHYDAAAQAFSGPTTLLRMPEVVPNGDGVRPATASAIEQSPLNAAGWYIYGAQDAAGTFVVQALTPRVLLRLVPQETISGVDAAMRYLRPAQWRATAPKGSASNALLCPADTDPQAVRADWQVGDQALLIHLYGGIGGQKAEAAARSPLYWGHFAFGVASVVHEPLAGEPIFDIVYNQIYAHNPDGVISGRQHYTRYSGDRQYGWAGTRPIQDVVIKLDGITGVFDFQGEPVSALDGIVEQLEVMAARYRIADGRGGTRVGAANNCAQDSSQALYAAIRHVGRILDVRPDVKAELARTPDGAARLEQLYSVGAALKQVLLPWGAARADWEYDMAVLGSKRSDGLFGSLGKALVSWRTMLPPVAARSLIEAMLKAGASAWVLRSSQVGGHDPEIEPIIPNV